MPKRIDEPLRRKSGGRMVSSSFSQSGFRTVFALAVFGASLCYAQFSSNVQGVVQDPSGAVIPKATVTLVNVATQVTRTTTSDENGNYRFVSLAPARTRSQLKRRATRNHNPTSLF